MTLSAAALSYLSAGPDLIGGLGGSAGFGEGTLTRTDDGSSAAIDITPVFGAGGLNLFGHAYTSLYVNNNGNITFAQASATFTPAAINGGASNPIIAAYWADVDTRGGAATASAGGNSTGSNLVHYDIDAANGVFTATWDDVGYFNRKINKLNAFQIQLLSTGSGNFDILLRYEAVAWTTGDFSGGSDGLGGSVARAGYSAGDGFNAYELPQSADQAAMLALPQTAGNTGETGLWVFHVLSGGPGDSSVVGNADADIISGSAGNNQIRGLGGDDALQGLDGNDVLGGAQGRDTLDGGAGDDTLIGGAGADSLVGGAGTDTATYADATSGVSVSLAAGTGTGGDAEGDVLTGIENLVGTGFADTLEGSAGDNRLYGLDGNDSLLGLDGSDLLVGGAGRDTLDGGTGDDRLHGGDGDDLYRVDSAQDLVFEQLGGGADTVAATVSYRLFDNVESLQLAAGAGALYGIGNAGANTILGNESNNTLLGGSGEDGLHGDAGDDLLFGEGGDDTLDGGAGADTLTGGAGDDTYVVDGRGDRIIELGGGGTDTVIATVGAGVANAYFMPAQVERLVLGGTADSRAQGQVLGNVMTGNAGANWLLGGGGDDTLAGGIGADVLFGEAGADTFIVIAGEGRDTIGDFTPGLDRIHLLSSPFTDLAGLLAATTEVNGVSIINLGGGDALWLRGVPKAQLQAGDFLFA